MQKKVNLLELYKLAESRGESLIAGDPTTQEGALIFMYPYSIGYQLFDREIARSRGFFCPAWNLQHEEDALGVLKQFQRDTLNYLIINQKSYIEQYQLHQETYKVYEPVSMRSDIHGGETFSSTSETAHGEQNRTDAYGAINRSDVYGQKNRTETYGEQDERATYGAKTTATVFGDQKETTVYSASIDSETHGEQVKETAYGATSEIETIGSHVQKEAINATTDPDLPGAELLPYERTETTKVAGFNTDEPVDSQSVTISETNGRKRKEFSEQTNEKTNSNHTDTETTNSYTDTVEKGSRTETVNTDSHTQSVDETEHVDTMARMEHVDTHTEDSYTDTHTTGNRTDTSTQEAYTDESNRQDTTTNQQTDIRTGNNGTPYSDLAKGHAEFWNYFRFYERLFNDLIANLCNYCDSGEPAMLAGLGGDWGGF